jgi:hypothetical protein
LKYTQGCFAGEKLWSKQREVNQCHNDPSHFINANVTYKKLQQNIKTRPVMNTSTASTCYGSSYGSRSRSAFGSSSGSGTRYNTGSKTGTGSGSGSIGPSIYGKVIVPTTTIKEKEKCIEQLQEQSRESNKAGFTMIGE